VQGIYVGDFRRVSSRLDDNSVRLIYTDPPYAKSHLELFGDLGAFAARVLEPGGHLLCHCGTRWLPDVLDNLRRHLRYHWTCAVIHTGRDALVRHQGVGCSFKPVLWFIKMKRNKSDPILRDSVISSPEKGLHPWQQSVEEAHHFIRRLSGPGDLVADPFCGTGTTLIAAKKLGRRWFGCDIDRDCVLTARRRVACMDI
jgi:DNA modification methylase